MSYTTIISQRVESMVFIDKKKEMIDIDILLEKTYLSYSKLLASLDLKASYDFSRRQNKRFFLHEFIKTYVEMAKSKDYHISFYNNMILRDKFHQVLIKKLRGTFGVNILENNSTLSELILHYDKRQSDVVTLVDMFLESNSKKDFRKIKKFLDKEGLTYLHDEYVENISNKMNLLIA